MSGTTPAVCSWGLFEQEIWDDPYDLYREVRGHGPVQRVTLFDGREAFLVTGYEAARVALADHRLSKDWVRDRRERPDQPPLFPAVLAKKHMLNSDPPDHTRLRGLVSRAFTPRRVEGLRGRIQEITDNLLAAMPTAGKVELIESFAFPLPIKVICELLGLPDDGAAELRRLFQDFLTFAYFPDKEEESGAADAQLDAFLADLVAEKRRHPGEDVLTALIAATDDDGGKLDEEELAGATFILVIAGHETTVNLIGNSVVALLRHPDQLEALRADPGLMPGAVHEFLRFDGPLHQATSRAALDDLEIAGVHIPAKSVVVVQVAAANRDPAHVSCPDQLDIRRPPDPHLAFGHGIHYCVGAPLALLEAEIALGSLIRHYPLMRLAVPEEELHWKRALTIRALQELPLEVSTEI